MNAILQLPAIHNEPIYGYAPGSPERAALEATLKALRKEQREVPCYVGAERIFTGNTQSLQPPHDHRHKLGVAHRGDASLVSKAIDEALMAKPAWERMHWEDRAAIFLKAAELIAGPYRYKVNAATMLAQSKTAHQSEIDAVCELVDFLRFNVEYMRMIYSQQPGSGPGIWNKMEYRPLEGFVFALTPFNFTAIAGNLPSSAALMGNTVVWKCADSQIYSADVIMQIFLEAGLPPGVINLVHVDGPTAGSVIFSHPQFAGLHFTGSTGVFNGMWRTIAQHMDHYRSYPRIVGETGGKDFILAYKDARPDEVATAIVRGAFEFQGQKCSAASRVYLPKSLAGTILERVKADLKRIKMGPVEDFSNFVGAVIDERSFKKIAGYIDHAKESPDLEIIAGGGYDGSKGWFIEPTVVLSHKPDTRLMREEIFGPVVTVYIYDDAQWEQVFKLVDDNEYALTGAIFAQDRRIIRQALDALRHSAGNIYINDKPTGAVVNQQPFGGGRGSGTNDKAGSYLNLLRWVSPRTIKETFVPPTDFPYPFLS
ncbi:MAG: L-glutamate gamma-semialdehyde dehydrogenase [Bacteroidetes bacterium]|nr:L-glutamate gamma-semialdehyde dehydrogenase [Bacteroidota bacterium]